MRQDTILTRSAEDGNGYEVIAGQRRVRAAELAGIDSVPAFVLPIDPDRAIITLVDSNIQRKSILPSERAFAYKMKLDAMKRQGYRTDLTSNQVGAKLQTDDIFLLEYSHCAIYNGSVKKRFYVSGEVVMRIRALFHHEAADVPYIREEYFEAPENATIQDLLRVSGHGEITDLSDYYPLSGSGSWGENYFPYLFVNGKASYGVLFQDAKITDFLNTHNITNHTIHVTVEFPLAGGLGACEILEAWDHIYPALEQIAVICTITGFSLKGLFSYLKKHFSKERQTPQVCFDIVLSRKQWNSSELSTLLDITPDKAKELLKLCDYRYDRTRMQYIQGRRPPALQRKHFIFAGRSFQPPWSAIAS